MSHLENTLNIVYGEEKEATKSMRIVADHMRTTVMLIGDKNGIVPSNVGAGYILRRIIRRAVRHANKLNLDVKELTNIAKIFIEKVYNEAYPLLIEKEDYIISELNKEIEKFTKALELGNKEFEKVITGVERKNQFMAGKEGFVPETKIN